MGQVNFNYTKMCINTIITFKYNKNRTRIKFQLNVPEQVNVFNFNPRANALYSGCISKHL
ncbi:MAG: hypothetical protein DRJ10_17080 [Bacteroidetes bacterium]|nr:MAG: hypothetical protein DRJ10_17080 [Bacteroidota bacterium]